MKNMHIGGTLDDFLEEEGLRADVEATAIKRVIANRAELEMNQPVVEESYKSFLIKPEDHL